MRNYLLFALCIQVSCWALPNPAPARTTISAIVDQSPKRKQSLSKQEKLEMTIRWSIIRRLTFNPR